MLNFNPPRNSAHNSPDFKRLKADNIRLWCDDNFGLCRLDYAEYDNDCHFTVRLVEAFAGYCNLPLAEEKLREKIGDTIHVGG